jgi:hypothetical protein
MEPEPPAGGAPVDESDNEESESTQEEEPEEPTDKPIVPKKISFFAKHKARLGAQQLQSLPNFILSVFESKQKMDLAFLSKCYATIYTDSFERNFPKIFAGYSCKEQNKLLFSALSGLFLRKQDSDGNYRRYVVIKFAVRKHESQDTFMLGLLEIGRGFTCPDTQFHNDRHMTFVKMFVKSKYVPHPFDAGRGRPNLGDTPIHVLQKRLNAKPRTSARHKKRGSGKARSKTDPEFVPAEEEEEEDPVSDTGSSGGRQRKRLGQGSSGSSKGHRGSAASADPLISEEQEGALNVLSYLSYDLIARAVPNPLLLAARCHEVANEKKKRGMSDDPDEQLIKQIDNDVKRSRAQTLKQLEMQGQESIRPSPAKWVQISQVLGENYSLHALMCEHVKHIFKGPSVEVPVVVTGIVSQRKLCRHTVSVPRPARQFSQTEELALEQQPLYVHMDYPCHHLEKNRLKLVLFNKTVTRGKWEHCFDEIQAAKDANKICLFVAAIHESVWEALPLQIKKQLFLVPQDVGLKNRYHFDFQGVTEAPLPDEEFMKKFCTTTLIEMYRMIDRHARASLKDSNGRFLHDVVEETLLPIVQDKIRYLNRSLDEQQKAYQERLSFYEDRELAHPNDPTNNKPSPPKILTLDGEATSEHIRIPEGVVAFFVPLPLAVICSPDCGLKHASTCACYAEEHFPNPVTGPIVKNYVRCPTKGNRELMGLTLPIGFLNLCRCPPLCWFFKGRF